MEESPVSFENIDTTSSEETSQEKATARHKERTDDVMNSLTSTTIQDSDTMDMNDFDKTTD